MAVREILLLGNPVLRTRCTRVKDFASGSVRRAIDDLKDTLADFRSRHAFGRGIAAPQIGVTEQILFIKYGVESAFINPKIVKRSRRMMTLWDDCFSFPDILVKIKRHSAITVEYMDEAGRTATCEAEGSLSELLQHEIDHLNGILAIDRAVDSKHIILRSEWEKLKHRKQQHPL